MTITRRDFVRLTGAAAGAAYVGLPNALVQAQAKKTFGIRLGYAAITWSGKDDDAIDDVSAVGFHGIQLRTSSLAIYGDRPKDLARRLEDKKLTMLCFSSGSVDALPEKRDTHLETHTKNAAFVKAAGGTRMQIISNRPKEHAPTNEEFDRLGALLNELGKRTGDLGVRLVLHNHMNAFDEAPEEVAHVMNVTDKRHVGLLLDIAHYKQGGGDPVAAVAKHADRIELLHFKDVVSPLPGDTKPARQSYEWVELGRGSVDVPGVLAALKKLPYDGPAVVELDKVPDPSRSTSKSPKECAEYNKRYVVEKLGLTL